MAPHGLGMPSPAVQLGQGGRHPGTYTANVFYILHLAHGMGPAPGNVLYQRILHVLAGPWLDIVGPSPLTILRPSYLHILPPRWRDLVGSSPVNSILPTYSTYYGWPLAGSCWLQPHDNSATNCFHKLYVAIGPKCTVIPAWLCSSQAFLCCPNFSKHVVAQVTLQQVVRVWR